MTVLLSPCLNYKVTDWITLNLTERLSTRLNYRIPDRVTEYLIKFGSPWLNYWIIDWITDYLTEYWLPDWNTEYLTQSSCKLPSLQVTPTKFSSDGKLANKLLLFTTSIRYHKYPGTTPGLGIPTWPSVVHRH